MKTDFETLLQPIYPELMRYARSIAGSKADGDDLLQDGLIKAWNSFSRLKEREKFKYWVLQIIRNSYRSKARQKWYKVFLPIDEAEQLYSEENLPFEEKEIVRQALRMIPFKQRESIILYEVLGMKVEEIARIQKVSNSAVKSRLSRGRSQLRKCYESLNDGGNGNEREFAHAG